MAKSGAPEPVQRRSETIYALRDPRGGEVRYVGRTSRYLPLRRDQHVSDAASYGFVHHGEGYGESRRQAWIWELLQADILPLIVPLVEFVPHQSAPAVEAAWMSYFAHRSNLLNIANRHRGSPRPPIPPTRGNCEKRITTLEGTRVKCWFALTHDECRVHWKGSTPDSRTLGFVDWYHANRLAERGGPDALFAYLGGPLQPFVIEKALLILNSPSSERRTNPKWPAVEAEMARFFKRRPPSPLRQEG